MSDHLLELFVDELFSRAPVIRPDAYIASAVAQARRSLNHQESRTMNRPSSELPSWLQPDSLGPYENILLSTLLYAPGPVIVLRGGTGSGKSSVLGYLCRHVHDAVIEHPSADARSGFRNLILQVDVQQFAPTGPTVDDGASNIDGLLCDIAKTLATFAEQIPHVQLLQTIAEVIDDHPRNEPAGIRHAVSAALRQAYRVPRDADPRGGAELVAFCEAVKLQPPTDQLVAWLSMYRALHRILNDGDIFGSRWPVVIVLDNVDPLSAQQQNALLKTLSRVTSGASWGASRIVLAARLSTFEQYIGALGFNHYDHQSPDPAEVVLTRSTLALLAPEAFSAFAAAQQATKSRIYDAVLELFVHLVDRGYFYEMLSAISGTNIRHALVLAHQWCRSVRVTAPPHEAWKQHEMKLRLCATICRNYLEELAHRVARESLRVIDDMSHRFEPDDIDAKLTADELFDAITRVLAAAEATRQISSADISPRGTISRKLRDGVLQELEGEPHGRVKLAMRCCIAEVLGRARVARVPEVVTTTAAELLKHRLYALAQDTSIASGLCRWVADTIDDKLSTEVELRELVRAKRASEVSERLPKLEKEKSRFEAEDLLLHADTQSDASVLNVFTVNGESLCPVVLHILYTLRCRGAADVTRAHLVQSLIVQGFEQEQILNGLSSVLKLSRRLIYSGIDDHIISIERWTADPGRVVRLASSGAGYLDSLLKIPSYVQWALALRSIQNQVGHKRKGDRSVRGRLWTARCGFEAAIGYETARLEGVWKNKQVLARSMHPKAQAPVVDVFFAVLDSFMHVYRVNHTKALTERTRRIEAAGLAQDAKDWVDLAEQTHGKLRAYLQGHAVESWRHAIHAARSDLAAMRGTIRFEAQR